MNITTLSRCSRIFIRKLTNQNIKRYSRNRKTDTKLVQRVTLKPKELSHRFTPTSSIQKIGILLGFSLFSKKDDEETPEDKIIVIIKRSILAIQRKEFDKAEQMLHLALRMAQDLQHRDGITYVYDVLANLAMERGHYEKAERLFAEVMKRLFADGETEDSPKILHMSSKMAHMAQLQENYDKALQGFTWTLEKLKNLPESDEVNEIKAITYDWYGQLLAQEEKFAEAKKYFQEAFDIFQSIYGDAYSELVPLLNNLSVAHLGLNDTQSATECMHKALEIAKKIPEATNEGLLQANLGLL